MPERAEIRRRSGPRGLLRLPGAVTLGVAAALIGVGGWGFGLIELTGVGVAALLVVVAGVARVLRWRPGVVCSRVVRPARVFAGGTVEVTIGITRTGRGRSPMLGFHDPITRPRGGRGVAVRDVAPIAPGERRVITHVVACPDRGIHTIGPARLGFTDPFGVATRYAPGPGPMTVTVLPRLVAVPPPPPARGTTHPGATAGVAGEAEFVSLRAYTPGDDLRRVHWRSSARSDDLMIRQDEEPRRSGCTVVLDVHVPDADPSTFERIVSAAASVLVAASTTGRRIRLVTTGGVDSGPGGGAGHLEEILVALATVRPSPRGPMPDVARGDPVVVVTADPDLAATPTTVVRVLFDGADPGTDPRTVVVGRRARFETAWRAHIDRGRSTPTRRS